MAGQMKAIETHYKGYRFRSRLEARWAVYLDAAGIAWDYETQGFDFGGGSLYLPDFWLPQFSAWAEVKPVALTDEERGKVESLVRGSGRPCILLIGTPAVASYPYVEFTNHGNASVPPSLCVTDCVVEHFRPNRLYLNTGVAPADDWMPNPHTFLPGTLAGYVAAARSARFEHGETGNPDYRPGGKYWPPF